MTNDEKAEIIAFNNGTSHYCENRDNCCHVYNSTDDCFKSAMQMAKWKDKQPILELGGWHTEEPTEDGWYLVDTPDFPKNCRCIVAEWDSHAKSFYSEAHDHSIDFNKWKLIERQ